MIINIKRSRKKYKSYSHELEERRKQKNKTWKSKSCWKRQFWIFKGRRTDSTKEIEIGKILNSAGIKYFKEVCFDLRIHRRFDFFIPVISLIIEYDGMQHFTSLKQINNDLFKEQILEGVEVDYIRFNRTHNINKELIKIISQCQKKQECS